MMANRRRPRGRCSSLAAAASLLLALAVARRDVPLLASAFTAPPGRQIVAAPRVGGASNLPNQPRRQRGAPRDTISYNMATVPQEASTATTTSVSEGGKPPSGGRTTSNNNSKLRQLKDRMWVREALEDITAAEFAASLSVERESDDEPTAVAEGGGEAKIWQGGAAKTRKRAVDFDNILSKLDVRIEEMCTRTSPEAAREMNRTCHVLSRSVGSNDEGDMVMEDTCYSLAEGRGMGSVVYTNEQREALLERLIGTRERLVSFIEGSANESEEMEGEDIDDIRSKLQPEDGSVATNGAASKGSATSKTTFDPSLYVREDGTVDWDGALQDREALKKFGSAVWSRINGQDPENTNSEEGDGGAVATAGDDHGASEKVVKVKIEVTAAIREKQGVLERLVEELGRMEEEHTKLLNSAISAGQAVANVNFATIDASLRNRIRVSSDALETKRTEATFRTLDYELERIYTYLEGELGNTAAKGYIPLQDRLNVAEFGLLESQIDSFNRQMELGENLDADVLAVVADQLVDFKRRLGIDYYVTGLTFDSEAIQVWLRDVWVKTKNGVAFYVKGTRLFVDDVVFCTSLILRALQGYTLKPREVRTLRRTFKDTITFIPVVIILIIPLSPIGHVLVFGAIQRVFPDFFPSCFTERRQNLLELYESTEYSAVTINETWQQKLVRISQAIRVLSMRLITKIYMSLRGDLAESDGSSDDTKGESS